MSPKDTRGLRVFVLDEYAPEISDPEARDRFFISLAIISLHYRQFGKMPWHPHRKARNCYRAVRKRVQGANEAKQMKSFNLWTLEMAQKALH